MIDSRSKPRGGRDQTDQSYDDDSGGAQHASLFQETPRTGGSDKKTKPSKARKLTVVQLKELEEEKEKEVLRGWKRIKELWARLLGQDMTDGASGDDDVEVDREGAEREWMLETEKLVEMFRETRMLFLTTKVCVFPAFHLGVIRHRMGCRLTNPCTEHISWYNTQTCG